MNVRNITCGSSAGLTGGLVFGAVIASLPMIAYTSWFTGLLVFLAASLLVGASFMAFFHLFIQCANNKLGYGLVYGGVWWLMGPLTLMPLMSGAAVNWNAVALSQVVYGAVLGLGYAWLQDWTTYSWQFLARGVDQSLKSQ